MKRAPVSPSLALPSAAAQLSLADVARDAFRRRFFLDAFAPERESLERSFAFLQRVREYKQQLGRRDVLQTAGEAIADEYLRDPAAHESVFLKSPPVAALVQRVLVAVDSKQCTPDLFSGVESHVNDRLEKEKYVAFLASPQYTQLCDALRRHRELPLGEVLVDARSTRFLEQFVRQTMAPTVGNLLFWVDVQTVFLPLIQTNVVSVTLFEEIQATVRRLYNHFLTESSVTVASVVPETLRKDILKRILQLQGEPFSPSRYATLFRQAQEKIWHWMQTIVYPKFQASMFYVALVVETENLESDRQLRKLSEHVQASHSPPATTTPKASAIVVPVESTTSQRLTSFTRYIRAIAPLQDEQKPCVWTKSLSLPVLLRDDMHVRAIQIVEVENANEDGHVEFKYQLNVNCDDEIDGKASAVHDIDFMDFVWNWRHIIIPSAILSPANRSHGTAPKPSFHTFILPAAGADASSVYGYVVTSWIHRSATSDKSLIERAQVSDHPIVPTPSPSQLLLPRFTVLLAAQSTNQQHVISGLAALADVSISDIQSDDLEGLFSTPSAGSKDSQLPARRLKAAYSGFYMRLNLDAVAFPVHWLFRELSQQTVIALLAALLAGKSLVIVSPRAPTLMLVANALVELLRPLDWEHFFLPLCPVRTACALADRGFFSSPSASASRAEGFHQSPFIIGLQGELVHLKTKESANEPRHRIRNSIYSVQRVNIQVRRPGLAHNTISCQSPDTAQYPPEILHTQAVVLDVDADDIYIPDRVEVPEFPQTLVRSLETTLKDARLGGELATEDSRLFRPPPVGPSFVDAMLEREGDGSLVQQPGVAPVDSVRLAVLAFMEALLGDALLYACSFRKSFAAEASVVSEGPETFILFEADAFLDAKMELGCREFFRQVFQTEMFRRFLVRQHRRFADVLS